MARVVHKGALHVLWVVGLQHPLVEAGPIAQEHNDLGEMSIRAKLGQARDAGSE